LNSGATTAAKALADVRDIAMEAEEDEPKSDRDYGEWWALFDQGLGWRNRSGDLDCSIILAITAFVIELSRSMLTGYQKRRHPRMF
jgi:hypothetical protein